jgi:hypothetical protein
MTPNDPCAEGQAIGSAVDATTATTTSVCPEAEDAVNLRPLTIQNLHEVKDLADKARAQASRARADNFPQIATAAAELEIKALRLLGEMLVKFNRFETNDEASVVTNDELLEFITSHPYSARLMAYLPDDKVTAIRQGAFNLSLGVAARRLHAAVSAPNRARAGPARAQKKKEAEEIVRRECETIRAARPGKWTPASYIVRNHIEDINEALERASLDPYKSATLVRIIGKVTPLHSK